MKVRKLLFTLTLALVLSVFTPKMIYGEDSKLMLAEVSAVNFSSGPNFDTALAHVYDGNPATTANYAAKKGTDAYENSPHFLFNLGVVCEISKYEIIFPDAERINNYELHASVDGVSYTKVGEFKGREYANAGKFEITTSFDAQFIKLVATGAYNNGTTLNENYIINEFTVFGKVKDVESRKLSIKSGVMAGFSATSPVEGTSINRAFDDVQTNFVKVIGNPLGDNAHFTFDLGETYRLSNVIINFGVTRAHYYKILVSIDGENFRQVAAHAEGVYDKTDGYYVKEESLGGVAARYVRVVAYGTKDSPGNLYYTINEISIYGRDMLIPEEYCDYAGSQIRTALVPYYTDGNIVEGQYRQGLRFCFDNLPELNSTIEVDGKNYSVTKQSAMVILKNNLAGKGELTINNTQIQSKMQILVDLLDYEGYKAVYIYNIPQANVDTAIVVRVFFECTDDNGDVIYLYGEAKEDSLASVFERMDSAQKAQLPADVLQWFE